jgi:hypothetical protein
VTTDWVAQHPTSATVRVVEVDVDTTAYDRKGRLGILARRESLKFEVC